MGQKLTGTCFTSEPEVRAKQIAMMCNAAPEAEVQVVTGRTSSDFGKSLFADGALPAPKNAQRCQRAGQQSDWSEENNDEDDSDPNANEDSGALVQEVAEQGVPSFASCCRGNSPRRRTENRTPPAAPNPLQEARALNRGDGAQAQGAQAAEQVDVEDSLVPVPSTSALVPSVPTVDAVAVFPPPTPSTSSTPAAPSAAPATSLVPPISSFGEAATPRSVAESTPRSGNAQRSRAGRRDVSRSTNSSPRSPRTRPCASPGSASEAEWNSSALLKELNLRAQSLSLELEFVPAPMPRTPMAYSARRLSSARRG
eukprot:TRINITY_DN19252_c0_g1_i1.p1 TRINITY_DN19252_c0_g1~~TRINITY_DN19252_c0_g1_i1.p1  ORF type:complete len:312 (+),score=51.08 TRINITY_DN19252_c0_g1_i1:127-1062(+)